MSVAWAAAPSRVTTRERLPDQPALPKIKVLHVITKFWAGAGGNTLLTAIGTDRDRYEVWVAGCEGGPLWERAEAEGVRTVRLRGFKETIAPLEDLRVLAQLIRLMRRERFSIVHTHSAKGGFLGRLAAWLCGVPVILYTFHGFSYHDFMSPARRWAYVHLERIAGFVTDSFFAVAPRVAREAVEMRLAPPGRITVAPSAVELATIPEGPDPRFRQELSLPPGTRIVGTVGRLDLQKAPLDFVRMAAIVAAHRSDVCFVMVGDGALMDVAEREARERGVDVVFTGHRADAPAIAASLDVFVISSLYEGLGRGLTEALASGRPVVATAVNGVPDIVEPGATGLLAPPADPAALARSVEWLLDHPSEAERMGGQARERVQGLFDPAHMCRIIEARYEELLGLPTNEAAPDQPRPEVSALNAAERQTSDGAPTAPPLGPSTATRSRSPDRPSHVTPSRDSGDGATGDARALNWRFLVPGEPEGMLLLPSNGERLRGAVVAERTSRALAGALAPGRYPAVAVPDLSGWVAIGAAADGAQGLLRRLGESVAPGGWLYAGFANAYSPMRPLRGALSRASAMRTLKAAGFADLHVYAPFPDQRLPAYLVSAAREAELQYFFRHLSFPHVEAASGLAAFIRRRARALLQRTARQLPAGISRRLVPSFAVVARRTP